jgi:hypothetical protein
MGVVKRPVFFIEMAPAAVREWQQLQDQTELIY